ncbi:hypothetical protein CMI38_06645 [Candidatus Pacearchaeota archaeon]|nr:hypothetical protein [Candidatus Pacearchaeota archaeon]
MIRKNNSQNNLNPLATIFVPGSFLNLTGIIEKNAPLDDSPIKLYERLTLYGTFAAAEFGRLALYSDIADTVNQIIN